MNAPTIIVPNKPKHASDPSHLDIPVSPYETSRNVDVDHPNEHSKDINARSGVHKINRAPARKSVEVKPKKHAPKGIHGRDLRIRYPELYNNCRYSVELIEEMKREHGEPRDCRVWIEEVLVAGVPEDHRQKCVVTKHPGFPAYWALFELVRRQDSGPHYRLVSIAMTPCPSKDYLSPALFGETHGDAQRWEHMRGHMGDPRSFTRQDFVLIHEWADSMTVDASQLIARWMPQTQEQVRKLRWIALCKKHEAREAQTYREKDKRENDAVQDLLEYRFDWIVQAANYGKKHKVSMNVPGMNPHYVIWQHATYKEPVRRGTSRHDEYLEAFNAAADAIIATWEAERGINRKWVPADELLEAATRRLAEFGVGLDALLARAVSLQVPKFTLELDYPIRREVIEEVHGDKRFADLTHSGTGSNPQTLAEYVRRQKQKE